MSVFEQMLKTIQDMVEGNRQEIQDLRNAMSSTKSRRQDTTRIEARLEEEARRSQELLDKLAETEGRLATTEAQNRSLSHTVKSQGALLEKKKALEFSDNELAEIQKYSAVIVFDTCAIMNCPNLLDGVNDGELVVVPKHVNNELENHKVNHYFDERKSKAQRAITAIFNYQRRFPLIYEEGFVDLVPEVYRANADEKEQNDNKILAVAIRYKRFSDVQVIFITDDRSLANKASGENIEVWTAKDFLTPPETSFDDEDTQASPSNTTDSMVNEAGVQTAEVISSEETELHEKAKEEFLAQKISTKVLHLEPSQISILQNNGIKTLADFLEQTESSFSNMKVKKGMVFTAKFLKEQEKLKAKLEEL